LCSLFGVGWSREIVLEVDVRPLFFCGIDKSGAFPQILLQVDSWNEIREKKQTSLLSEYGDILKNIRSSVMQDVNAELGAIKGLQEKGHVIVKAVRVSGYNVSKEFYLDCELDWNVGKRGHLAYESAFGDALMDFFMFGADTIEKIALVAPVFHWGPYSEPGQMKKEFPCMTALSRVEAQCFPG
jgi:hypothetical protein